MNQVPPDNACSHRYSRQSQRRLPILHIATLHLEDLTTAPICIFGCCCILCGLYPRFFHPARPNDFHRQQRAQASRNVSQCQASLLCKSALLLRHISLRTIRRPRKIRQHAATRRLSWEPYYRLLPRSFVPLYRHAAILLCSLCSVCTIILRRDLLLRSYGALCCSHWRQPPRLLLDGRPPRNHRQRFDRPRLPRPLHGLPLRIRPQKDSAASGAPTVTAPPHRLLLPPLPSPLLPRPVDP